MSPRREETKNLSLTQKLQLLVILPLAFEFVFVVSLGALWLASQNDTERINRAKETQVVGTEILSEMNTLVSTAFLYSQKGDSAVFKSYNDSKAQVKPKLAKLRVACATNPDAERSAERVAVLMYRLIDSLDALANSSKTSFVDFSQAASASVTSSRLIFRECRKISEIQKQIHPSTRFSDWQSIIPAVYLTGLALSVVVSILAFRFVQLDFLNRLTSMMRNTEALGRREPLKEVVDGTDEIASLDKIIHSTDDALRQLERTRQEFVSMLTHDMRAPLTQIQFSVGVLADGTYEQAPEKRQTMLSSLVPEIARLNRMIDDLLTANKLDSEPLKLNLEAVYAKDMLEQVRDAMQTEAVSRNRSITVSGDDSEITVDSFQFGRVLTNLCANALKYTDVDSVVEMSCQADADTVIIEVKDEGPGVPAELAPHLFERYRQGDEEQTRSGFGLGLYIAKSIVEAHGGEIGFYNRSADETGCAFFIRLKANT